MSTVFHQSISVDRADKSELRCGKAGSQIRKKPELFKLMRSKINGILTPYANKRQPKFNFNVVFKSFKRYDSITLFV